LWEGHRRTDRVRVGLFTGGTYLWAWKGQDPHGFDPTGKPTAATLNLYPLPSNELIANPNLHQNPGY
ncbi:MAG TPA: RagB/SusD family nutrient uptake outer membrane protein, partial [Gemmatimonadales bacterium]|nr:RagB/SusD family nutrient uptake outer membrane protein [Gemmatimonadales bacterium]